MVSLGLLRLGKVQSSTLLDHLLPRYKRRPPHSHATSYRVPAFLEYLKKLLHFQLLINKSYSARLLASYCYNSLAHRSHTHNKNHQPSFAVYGLHKLLVAARLAMPRLMLLRKLAALAPQSHLCSLIADLPRAATPSLSACVLAHKTTHQVPHSLNGIIHDPEYPLS